MLTFLYIYIILNIILLIFLLYDSFKKEELSEHLFWILVPYFGVPMFLYYLIQGLYEYLDIKTDLILIGYLLNLYKFDGTPYDVWLRVRNYSRKEKRRGVLNSRVYKKVLINAYKYTHND